MEQNNDFMYGNSWFWIVIILLFGGGFGMNRNNNLDDEFIKRDIFNTNQNVSNTACATQKEVLENRYNTQLGLSDLGARQAQCCCETKQEILQNRYDNSLGQCDIKTTIHNEAEATRALITANQIQDLRDQLAQEQRANLANTLVSSNQIQTQNILGALVPTPRPAYIVASPYATFNNGGCGCGNY